MNDRTARLASLVSSHWLAGSTFGEIEIAVRRMPDREPVTFGGLRYSRVKFAQIVWRDCMSRERSAGILPVLRYEG